jgi:hypothetical protein
MTAFTLGQATALALKAIETQGSSRALPLRRRPSRLGALHRTGLPVRRDSIEAGTFEEMFFAIPAKGETDRLLRMARRTLDAGRQLRREARSGARELTRSERLIASLTAAAVRVYEEICTLARLNRGRVFPTYDHLAKATALGRATIARALHMLEAIGFLVRQRRFRRVGGERPRYKQTSSVYRPTEAPRVLPYLPRWMRPVPIPDDQVQHNADRREAQAGMLAQLSCRELAHALVGGPLGRMLVKLGGRVDDIAALEACESQNNPRSLLTSIQKG